MTIEEKVFIRKRFNVAAMLRFGFTESKGGYLYVFSFLDGDFTAEIFVTKEGKVSGKVFDAMNEEEYLPLRNQSFQGAYVHSVRTAYEEALVKIAETCCVSLLFACDQANRLTAYICDRYGVEPDFPWEQSEAETYGVFRHRDNAKWFALIMNVKKTVVLKNGDESMVDIVNLKADPALIPRLTMREGIYPAYHMNRKYWISVMLNNQVTDEEVFQLLDGSYQLTKQGKTKKGAKPYKE